MARAEAVERLDQFVTLHYPGNPEPLTLRRRPDGSYVHRSASLELVTETAKGLLRGGEDRRQPYRVDGWDVIGRLRSLAANAKRALTGRGTAQGGSPISEQLGGMLFDIRPSSEPTLAARLRAKAVKFLIGTRLDDLYGRDDQVRRYLSRVSFGSYRGHEVEGLRAAAHAFYAVEPEDLTAAQLADLIARVQSPSIYFPYSRPGESPADFVARHQRHKERAEWVLEMGAKDGVLTPEEHEQARRELFTGLRPAEELRAHLTRPGLFTVFRELERRVPGAVRHLDVGVGLDGRAQRALDFAVAEARKDLAAAASGRVGDEIVIDAVVLGESGAIRARAGLYTTPGDGASQYKGEIYAVALERGLIHAISDEVSPGMSASAALSTSNNPAAMDLARKIGLELYRAHLEGQGLRVTGPFPSIALGAGVDGSPLTAAAMFNKFGYTSPGSVFEDPSLLAEVHEAESGRPVFAPRRRQLLQPGVCAEVRKALEACALKGTAHVLAPLARAGAVSAKTGTSGFVKEGVLTGNGGSWILVNDGPSRSTVAVRVRWRSGHPFAPNGGRSAALVALHLLPRLRAIN
jgi:membrane peptidoglycan carboxypeptidase